MINLALIGTGRWGQNYINIIKSLSGVRLVCICANHKDSLAIFSPRYKKTTNYRDIFKEENIDGIIIASPASTHFSIAKDFVERGYDILVEKPLTTNYDDAIVLKKICVNNKKNFVLVGHIYQYHPAFLKAKEYTSRMRKIIYIDFEWSDWGPVRNDVSALWDWAPHVIGMSVDMLGMPKTVSAFGSRDMNMIYLSYESGAYAFVKIGWLSPVAKRRMTAVGQGGRSVIFDDSKEKKVEVFKKQAGKGKVFYPAFSTVSPLKRQILEFIDCIKTRNIPKTDIVSSIQIINIIQCAQQSLDRKGLAVKI